MTSSYTAALEEALRLIRDSNRHAKFCTWNPARPRKAAAACSPGCPVIVARTALATPVERRPLREDARIREVMAQVLRDGYGDWPPSAYIARLLDAIDAHLASRGGTK